MCKTHDIAIARTEYGHVWRFRMSARKKFINMPFSDKHHMRKIYSFTVWVMH